MRGAGTVWEAIRSVLEAFVGLPIHWLVHALFINAPLLIVLILALLAAAGLAFWTRIRGVSAAPQPGLGGLLRLGLTVKQVEEILGPASEVHQLQQGDLNVIRRAYLMEDKQVVALFVRGVLVDYSITLVKSEQDMPAA